jgi:hypothetical protein
MKFSNRFCFCLFVEAKSGSGSFIFIQTDILVAEWVIIHVVVIDVRQKLVINVYRYF